MVNDLPTGPLKFDEWQTLANLLRRFEQWQTLTTHERDIAINAYNTVRDVYKKIYVPGE